VIEQREFFHVEAGWYEVSAGAMRVAVDSLVTFFSHDLPQA